MTCRIDRSHLAIPLVAGLWIHPVLAEEETRKSLDLGADVRLREVVVDNVGFNSGNATGDRNFQRLRVRGWGLYSPADDLSIGARLTWEGRHYNRPEKDDWPLAGFETWYHGSVLLDNLVIEDKPWASVPLTIRAGRQDLMLGNGWLVMDGSPLDGSRTTYLDAVRVTYQFSGSNLDLVYINQSADTGRFPSALDGDSEDQTEQDETGAILYLRNESWMENTALDAYFIFKGNDPNDTVNNIRVNNGVPFPSVADDGEIYTIGARLDTHWDEHWGLQAELAGQWGHARGPDLVKTQLEAWGFNSRLSYAFRDAHQNSLHLDLEMLSGDDPDTATVEAFDPLWGRWPRWSELYIYQAPLDYRIAQATNLTRLSAGWSIRVHPTTELLFDYHALWANEESAQTLSQYANISQDGTFRGHLFSGWLKTTLNKYWSFHLVAEYMDPGDFYAESSRDDSCFVRAQVVLTL